MTARESRSSWIESDHIARSLSNIVSPADYSSKTLNSDQSQPPTPDGTGRPANFQTIAPGIYRSSYPSLEHFRNLEGLALRTIVTLVPEQLPQEYQDFITVCGIKHYHIPILANKDAEIYTPASTVIRIIELMMDIANYPILVHCNKGKHRTGCMTACFRKVCGWTDEAAVAEYVRYSEPKSRDLDKTFISRFDADVLKPMAMERGYVGGPYKQPIGPWSESERSVFTMYTTRSVATYGHSEFGEPEEDCQEKAMRQNDEIFEQTNTNEK